MVLVLAMLFSAMLGVISFAGSESEPVAALEVSQANLEFGNAVYLYVAVNYSAVGSANGITLKITNNKTDESTILSPDSSISAPSNCVAFKYIDLGAKNMGDELTLQALKDGKASGDAKTYSILEYALKAQGQGDANLSALMVAMLQYGADAQAAFSHSGSYDLTKEYTLVSVTGIASLEGGASKALVARGTKLSATATANDAVWYDSTVQRKGTGASLEIDTTKTYQSFFAVPASVTHAVAGEFSGDAITGTGNIDKNNTVTGTKPAWFSGKTGTTAKATSTVFWEPGYMGMKHGGFTYVSVDFTTSLTAGMTYAADNNDCFTVSVTLAGDGDNSDTLGHISIRVNGTSVLTAGPNGKKTGGRLQILRGVTDGKICAAYNVGGTAAGDNNIVVATSSTAGVEAGKPGSFVTIHVVFDLSETHTCPACNAGSGMATCASCGGKGKAPVMLYYAGNSTVPVATTVCPLNAAEFKAALALGTSKTRMDSDAGGTGTHYLKAMVVTNGNITEYFK